MSKAVNKEHDRPVGASDELVAAVGKVSEAFEHVERARGALYTFHQAIGHADFILGDAVEMLRKVGQEEFAHELETNIVGRNVLQGRWTFQIVEEFNDLYYDELKNYDKRLRDETMDGKRHVFEAELKEKRRTKGLSGHEAGPLITD